MLEGRSLGRIEGSLSGSVVFHWLNTYRLIKIYKFVMKRIFFVE